MDFDDDRVRALVSLMNVRAPVPRRFWWRVAARRLASVRSPAAVRGLAEAYVGARDDRVVAIAAAALAGLDDQGSIDAVCDTAIVSGDERLAALVGRAGYLHSDPARRALQLFLAGDFERYAELDFDGGMLAAARSVADERLRARLAGRARASARVDWVHAVAGSDRAGDRRALADGEWESALSILASTGRWDEMWRLVAQAPPVWGVRLLKTLGGQRWRPAEDAERAGFDELVDLARACSDDPASNFLAAEPTVLIANRHKGRVSCLAVTPDGSLLASNGVEGTVQLWRLPSGQSAGVLTCHDYHVSNVVLTPDGALLATTGGGSERTVKLWRLPSGEPAGVLRGHPHGVMCLAVTPDGALLAGGGIDGAVRLWRLPSGEPAGILPGHNNSVDCLAVTPDGRLLVSGGNDGTVRLWRLPSGQPVGVLPGHTIVKSIAVAPDSTLLASGYFDGGLVRLWHLPSGQPAGPASFQFDYRHGVSSLAVTSGGTLLASVGTYQKTVRLWHLPSGAPAGDLTGHPGRVECLAATPDGILLATGGGNDDGTVRVWRAGLRAASRTPIDDLDLSEVVALADAATDERERAWGRMIPALVRQRHRYDIEVGDAIRRGTDTDIEVGE